MAELRQDFVESAGTTNALNSLVLSKGYFGSSVGSLMPNGASCCHPPLNV